MVIKVGTIATIGLGRQDAKKIEVFIKAEDKKVVQPAPEFLLLKFFAIILGIKAILFLLLMIGAVYTNLF